MPLTYTPHIGLMVAGHNELARDLLDEGRQFLVDHAGQTAEAAEELLPDISLVRRAYLAPGGFVGETHPQAAAVTVVNVPLSLPMNVDPAVAIAARRQLARDAARAALAGLDPATRAAVIAEVGP